MFTKPRRPGTLNVRYSVLDFMLFHLKPGGPVILELADAPYVYGKLCKKSTLFHDGLPHKLDLGHVWRDNQVVVTDSP